MEYLDSHAEITNKIGRHLTGITSENSMKDVFYALRKTGKLEMVPGKRGNTSAWRRPPPTNSTTGAGTDTDKPTGAAPKIDRDKDGIDCDS